MEDARRLTGEERQELVAYLDGELDKQLSEQLEAKIHTSASARREVEAMRRTWELLDFLPMPEAATNFTQRTVQLLTVADQRLEQVSRSVTELTRAALMLGGWLAALAGSFALGVVAVEKWPHPDQGVVENLPVLERFEDYRAVQDVEFLRLLRDRKTLDEIEQPFETGP